MSSAAQINANRQNALKSTGPRTDAGKNISRFNALKTGAEAKSLVIPGEDPAKLEALARAYQEELQPAGMVETFFVDNIIRADWERRRLTRIEAEYFQFQLTERRRHAATEFPVFGSQMAQLLERRIAATERSYFRNLKELRRLQTQRIDAEIHAAEIAACAGPAPTQTPAKPAAEANPQTPDQPATVLESAEIGFDSQNQNRPINLALKSTIKLPPMLEGMNLKDLKR